MSSPASRKVSAILRVPTLRSRKVVVDHPSSCGDALGPVRRLGYLILGKVIVLGDSGQRLPRTNARQDCVDRRTRGCEDRPAEVDVRVGDNSGDLELRKMDTLGI